MNKSDITDFLNFFWFEAFFLFVFLQIVAKVYMTALRQIQIVLKFDGESHQDRLA